MHACSVTQSCLTVCDAMDCGPSGSSVHGIFQTRILEWVAISSSRGSSLPRIQLVSPASPALAGGFFTTALPGKPKVNIPFATWNLRGSAELFLQEMHNISVMQCVPNGLKTISCLTLGYVSFCC